MNLQKFLQRINFLDRPEVSTTSLVDLHRSYVLSVPFENFFVINGIPILLDQESFYKKIVEKRRGGFCYELNGLFRKALEEIGFDTCFVGCSVYIPPLDTFGSEFGHLAIVATIAGEKYLVDVGFGDAFLEPLKLTYGEPQFQFGTYYRLTKLPEDEILLEKSPDNLHYQKMYKLQLRPRLLPDFAASCEFHQTSPQAPFTKKPLISRPTLDGRMTLTSTSFTFTRGREKEETAVISEEHFEQLLNKHFGMKFRMDPDVVV